VLRVAPQPRIAQPKRRIDLETLQAVVTNRYDLLARYTRDLRRAYREELAKLKIPAGERERFALLSRWLRKGDMNAIPAAQQQTMREVLAQSGVMKTLVDMRTELAATWERSSASREQMLAHLQDWIARAEASGIRALQNVALRIRSYAPAPVAA
jgi:stearoyl-CoA desaturase (delta-9 desaturase)